MTSDSERPAGSARRITDAVRRARAALAFEAVWPAVVAPLLVVALFCIVSWLGLWLIVPTLLRFLLLGLFALLLLAALWPATRVRLAGAPAALRRVETRSRLAHRPLTGLSDRLAGSGADAGSAALWQAHRQRLAAGIDRLEAGLPEPRLAARDPYALRAAVLLVFLVALFWAGPDWRGRLQSAFMPPAASETVLARIDAWVSPPGYTGRPPVMLTGGEDGGLAERALSVPQGSKLVIRSSAAGDLAVEARRGEEAMPLAPEGGAGGPAEVALQLDEDIAVSVNADGRALHEWQFTVIADQPPMITLIGEPERTASNALQLGYAIEDDYGVAGAEARFAPLDPALAGAEPLIAAPSFPLSLPQLRARSGSGQTIKDLTAHPWAGAPVALTLIARDEAGQEGMSAPAELVLPQRTFRQPLARAIVEQRRNLALDRSARERTLLALDALSLEPETYIGDSRVYLGLRSAYWRLRNARDDETLRTVLDQLWEVALQIEDGELSLAAQALRDIQERLMQALEQNAPDEELEQLMAELRQALNDFMREMARRALENQDMARAPMDPNAQILTPDDLQRMLDAIENMARSGARDAARQMLSDLQQMLENLQNGQMQAGPMQSGPMNEMMGELGDMIRRQQELMDQTFDLNRNRQSGEGGENGEQLGELGEGQAALREALRELLQRMEELGAQPGGELGEAGEAMGEAERSLGGGDTGEALGQQGRALDNLRRGAQSMAEQMGPGGEGMAQGEPGGQGRERTDPFGRPLRSEGPDYGTTVRVPDEIDVQRAREILEELRRRLSDPERPRLERDYLERLLEHF